MPKINIPGAISGDWHILDRQHEAELWRREFPDPSGQTVTLFYVGSEHTPETPSFSNLTDARSAFAVFQLKSQ